MRRSVVFFTVAILAATLGFLSLAHFENRFAEQSFQERRATVIARALAWSATQEELREDDAAEDLGQRFAEAVKKNVTGIDEALVLRNTKFRAHSNSERAGGRLDRESLDDKALYDGFKRIGAEVKKNVEERERNPELTGNPYREIEVVRTGDVIVSSVPVVTEDRYRAMAQITTKAETVPAFFPFSLLLFLVGGLVIFAVLEPRVKGFAMLGGGIVLILGMLVLQAWTMVSWRELVRTDHTRRLAETQGQLAKAGLLQLAKGDDAKGLPRAISKTSKGEPENDLLEIRTSTLTAEPPPNHHKYDVGTFTVFYSGDYFAEKRATDAKNIVPWSIGFGLIAIAIFLLGALGQVARGWKSFLEHRYAYAYMSPAMTGMVILVFLPVVYGITLGFFTRKYNEWTFAGLSNFAAIVTDFDFANPQGFYYTLGVTLLWTFSNVILHVSIGLFLAILLNDQFLKAKGLFRVILVIPWAVPNYITALIWKAMFHKQFGAVNLFLETVGLEPVAWFQSFWPSFFTNLATNTWLGFPFMMVVSLGALQSIPTDLYEAAVVDGASKWQRFKGITLPLLMPALVPAVIVGSVWTFNMFNIIYLVSGGAPTGATDILITDAFRWAFERDNYGYAAAYSTIIFIILIIFTLTTNKITGATKGAYE